jgi:hypothetical protein
MTPIKDGKGRGYQAIVDALQELHVSSRGYTPIAKASEEGWAFAWNAVSADIDAGDTALLLTNTSTLRKLRIGKVYLYCDVEQQFDIHLPAYSASFTGTTVTGVCLNKTINRTAEATAYADETANSQGSIITTLHSNELATDQFGILYDFEGAVILGYRDSIAVDLINEPGAFEATLLGWYEDN